MNSETIYVLHKQGAPNHYIGLEYLLKKHGLKLEMREFSLFTPFFKGLKKFNFHLVRKQFTNFYFLLDLLGDQNKKVVVGIAPFDSKIRFLMRFLKNHKVYYHTSWSTWDKTFHPKTKGNNEKVFEAWRLFLEEKCEHIFCVTERTRNQLIDNYRISPSKTSVVYHALHEEFSKPRDVEKRPKSFIYYGRMIKQKGIQEILQYFSKNPHTSLTLIGKGKEQDLVLSYSKKHKNIKYSSEISNKAELVDELAEHEYLILNTSGFELFGMVIIESMAQGVIPICRRQTGPEEIINTETGFLFEEGEVATTISSALEKRNELDKMRLLAIVKSKKYHIENICKRWNPILN